MTRRFCDRCDREIEDEQAGGWSVKSEPVFENKRYSLSIEVCLAATTSGQRSPGDLCARCARKLIAHALGLELPSTKSTTST